MTQIETTTTDTAAPAPKHLRAPVPIQSRAERFTSTEVSDFPAVTGYRQVTDAHLLTLARRHGVRLVTFDAGLHALAGADGVELLKR